MLLPFPTWQASGPGKVQPVDLSATSHDKNQTQPAAKRAEVTPIFVVRFDDSHAAMLTSTVPVDEDGQPFTCHACPGIVGAYFFEHHSSGWRLRVRQDAATQSGLEGNIGTASIVKLAESHYALASEWGSCWQGYCGTWLVVLGLTPGKASLLAAGIPLSVDNDGAHDACSALDAPQKEPAEPEDKNECLQIQSKWTFKGGRLHINFDGRLSNLEGNNTLLPTEKVHTEAIYEIKGDHLELARGTNPVPSF